MTDFAPASGPASVAGGLLQSLNAPMLGSFQSSEPIYRTCFHPTRPTLIAVGGETSVVVLEINIDASRGSDDVRWNTTVKCSWRIGQPVSAICWRSRPDEDELLVASAQTVSSLRLNEDDNDEERGRETIAQAPSPIRDLDYRRDHDVLAVATDEGCVIYPLARDEDSEPVFIPLPHPSRSVSFHPKKSSLLLVTDTFGSGRLLDYDRATSRVLLTLNEPRALTRQGGGGSFASLKWNPSEPDVCGGIVAGRWVAYDLRAINGGRPIVHGDAYPSDLQAREVFRWHPSNARLFATMSAHPKSSPAVKVFSTAFPQVPRPINAAPGTRRALDMDWHCVKEVLAVVVEQTVVFVKAG